VDYVIFKKGYAIMGVSFVYHVVTEKPMNLGQMIIFNDNHPNGVYHRVMACQKLLDGHPATDELSLFITGNLEYWAIRTYRELAMEKVRRDKYPHFPSRMSCLYTSRTLSDAEMWASSFRSSGRRVYQIVKLRADGSVFDGDAFNVFEGGDDAYKNERNAEHYWSSNPNKLGKAPLVETLINGNIEVVEIVREWI